MAALGRASARLIRSGWTSPSSPQPGGASSRGLGPRSRSRAQQVIAFRRLYVTISA